VNAADGEQCDGNTRGNQCTNVCTNECKWLTPTTDPVTQKIIPTCKPDDAVAATAMKGCGDGTLDSSSGEECDLGLECAAGKDPTTSSCKVGGQNNIKCVPGYGQNNSCQYCTASCKKGYVSGGFCGDGTIDGPEECDVKVSFDVACNPESFDYHTLECAQSCTIKKGVGSCQSCAINSSKIAKDKTPTAVVAKVKLTDETLGWIPGVVGVKAGMVRSVKSNFSTEFIKNFVNPDNYFHDIIGDMNTLEKKYQISLDPNLSCTTASHYYTLQFFGSPDDQGMMTVPEQEDFPYLGGAFEYMMATKNYTSQSAFNSEDIVNLKPVGNAGDYRIVLEAPSTVKPSIKISNKANSPSVLPEKNGYIVSLSSGMSANCEKTLAGNLESFINNEARIRNSGCTINAPYVGYDRAYKYKPYNGASVIVETSMRHIFTIRKQSGKFYDAVYEFKVSDLDAYDPAKVTVYKFVNNAWDPVFVGELETLLAKRGVPNQRWNVFTFIGEGPIKPGNLKAYNDAATSNTTLQKVKIPMDNTF
jgi:hypothetical protein